MTAAALQPPAGRQGPGPMPGALLRRLDLALVRRSGGQLPGDHLSPGAGSGTELVQLRPYQVGDDVRQLDAAATARTGVPHVRLQVPERTLTTWLVLDVSPSMAFGTAQRLKADVAEGVALAVARLATRRGGRAALLRSGSEDELMLPPRGGRHARIALERALAEGVAPDGSARPGALARTLTRAGRVARRPGLIVVVSDFRDPEGGLTPLRRGDPSGGSDPSRGFGSTRGLASLQATPEGSDPGRGLTPSGAAGWRAPLAALSARHSVVAVEIRDPREGSLPAAGRLALVDPETGDVVEVDSDRVRDRYAALETERREAVTAALRGCRADHIVLDTEQDWLRNLGRGLDRR